MQKIDIKEIVVGLIVSAIFIVFVIFINEDKIDENGYKLHARIDRVDGLAVGSDVVLGGKKIGEINRIRLDPDNFEAIVTLYITNKILKIPADSNLRVLNIGLMGHSYVEIQPGGDMIYLAHGDQINFTQGSINVIDLVAKAIYTKEEFDKAYATRRSVNP
ncbi:MAG: MlaD family protein [Alphaproteobacteria bacterium]|nr:MlaD family protein [Alphaproteobacteria bacterium]